MKKEDIEFLKELQHELNTQDTDGQADPRYWGIMGRKTVPTADCNGDDWRFVVENEMYTAEEFVEMIDNEYVVQMDGCNAARWNKLKNEILADYYQPYWSDDIPAFIFSATGLNVYTVDVIEQDFLYENAMFLTKRSAKEHIEKNGYHYENPRTYAMTAWRSPEVERLISIIKNMNVSDIKED